MGVGANIKKIREVRNYTQAFMAEQLNMSLGGYGNIERDETDITISRLSQIAAILKSGLSEILEMESGQVFNQYNNNTATANGIVHNQQIIGDKGLHEIFVKMNEEINNLKAKLDKIQQN